MQRRAETRAQRASLGRSTRARAHHVQRWAQRHERLQVGRRRGVATRGDAQKDVPEHADTVIVATRVGRYEIHGMLGEGGVGIIYRAHDPYLSRDVALKLIQARRTADADWYQACLLREAQALARLSHPNVVAAFDVGTHDGRIYVAMEVIEGASLYTWLSTARSRREIVRVLISAGRGLGAAHAAGVMHRDFKPSNVMVSPDGRVRVVDFGLTRSLEVGQLDDCAGAWSRGPC